MTGWGSSWTSRHPLGLCLRAHRGTLGPSTTGGAPSPGEVGMMRRTLLLLAMTVLALAMLAPPAGAGGRPDFGHFTVTCEGIYASGRVLGWGGVKLVESAEGIPLQSVAIFWSGSQETWVNPGVIPPTTDPDAVGWWAYPGPHARLVSPCEGTLEWHFLGDHYFAQLHEMEVMFTPPRA